MDAPAKKQKCENVREQPYTKPSNRNLNGKTWRKCGRVAVVKTQISERWLCKGCAEHFHIPLPSK